MCSELQFVVNGVAGYFLRMIRVYFAMANMVTETRRCDSFSPFAQCFGAHCLPGVLKYPSAFRSCRNGVAPEERSPSPNWELT